MHGPHYFSYSDIIQTTIPCRHYTTLILNFGPFFFTWIPSRHFGLICVLMRPIIFSCGTMQPSAVLYTCATWYFLIWVLRNPLFFLWVLRNPLPFCTFVVQPGTSLYATRYSSCGYYTTLCHFVHLLCNLALLDLGFYTTLYLSCGYYATLCHLYRCATWYVFLGFMQPIIFLVGQCKPLPFLVMLFCSLVLYLGFYTTCYFSSGYYAALGHFV